jgi:hypothetical protein
MRLILLELESYGNSCSCKGSLMSQFGVRKEFVDRFLKCDFLIKPLSHTLTSNFLEKLGLVNVDEKS